MRSTEDPTVAVRHEPERSRFVVDLPDGQAELLYGEFAEDVLDFQHTEVPESGRGKGVGDARVMATCPYVRAWLRRHPGERPA
jgi:predicted GNAT family acetyltransferase